MKNIKFLLTFIVLGFLVLSCREDHTEPEYNGSSKLHFNMGTSASQFVSIGSTSKDIEISYGIIKEATSAGQVKLVVDAAESTAVQGVDFQILKGVDDITPGELGGKFSVRILEPASSQLTKKVVFKLESATIEQAVFDNSYTLNWKLQCLITDFLGTNGNFKNIGWWIAPTPQMNFTIQTVATEPGIMYVRNFFETGRDLKLAYDSEGKITFDNQYTGWDYDFQGAGRQVFIRMNPDPTKASVADFCSRTMKLESQYMFMVGTTTYTFSGDTTESFTGL